MRGAIRQFINWWRDAGSSAGAGTADRIPVLAITTDDLDKRALLKFSTRGQWDLILSTEWEQALEILKGGRVSVILCDRALPGLDWRDVLATLAASRPDCAVVLTSPVNDNYLWEEVIRRGGYDVLPKPLEEDQTVRVVNLAWSYSRNQTGIHTGANARAT